MNKIEFKNKINFPIILTTFLAIGCNGIDNKNKSDKSLQSALLATNFHSDYLRNKEEFDVLYKNNEIIVKGAVWDVTKDKCRILLDYKKESGSGVVCIATYGSFFKSINLGDSILIKGVFRGMPSNNIDISDCSVLKIW